MKIMSRRKYQKGRQSRWSFVGVIAVVLILLLMVSYKSVELRKKQDGYQVRKQELQAQIDAEEARAEELVNLRKYVQTDSYTQQVAEEKLGLVREGEILFKTK